MQRSARVSPPDCRSAGSAKACDVSLALSRPRFSDQARRVADLARRAWSLKRGLDSARETSHAFALPALLQSGGDTLADRCIAWADRVHCVEAELASIQSEIDQQCFDLYNIDEVDRRTATQGFDS